MLHIPYPLREVIYVDLLSQSLKSTWTRRLDPSPIISLHIHSALSVINTLSRTLTLDCRCGCIRSMSSSSEGNTARRHDLGRWTLRPPLSGSESNGRWKDFPLSAMSTHVGTPCSVRWKNMIENFRQDCTSRSTPVNAEILLCVRWWNKKNEPVDIVKGWLPIFQRSHRRSDPYGSLINHVGT